MLSSYLWGMRTIKARVIHGRSGDRVFARAAYLPVRLESWPGMPFPGTPFGAMPDEKRIRERPRGARIRPIHAADRLKVLLKDATRAAGARYTWLAGQTT